MNTELYPYPDMKEQFIPGDAPASVAEAYVIMMERQQGPPLYFVKDIRYKPPKEYWSAVEGMAKRFGHFLLAVDYGRYLENKPGFCPLGRMKVDKIKHRETVSVQMTRHSLADVLEVPRDSKGFLAWITTYRGVIGERKQEEPIKVYRPPTQDDVAKEIVERYSKLVNGYKGPKGSGREYL